METPVRYRQFQQVLELQGFYREGRGREMHPNPCLYGSGWGSPIYSEHLKPITAALTNLEPSTLYNGDCHYLEIGCGGGRWTTIIAQKAERFDQMAFTVVDATPDAFALTKRWLELIELPLPTRELICLDGMLMGIADSSVDVVWCFDVFVHFDTALIANYLQAVHRVLKPGGVLMANFGCEFPGYPEWERSDLWFEYVCREERGRIFFYDPLFTVVEGLFRCEMPVPLRTGYGSTFFQMRKIA